MEGKRGIAADFLLLQQCLFSGSSRKVRESPSSNLLEVEGRRKALLVRRAFHGTAVTHAADNQGIIPKENVKNHKKCLQQTLQAVSFAIRYPDGPGQRRERSDRHRLHPPAGYRPDGLLRK